MPISAFLAAFLQVTRWGLILRPGHRLAIFVLNHPPRLVIMQVTQTFRTVPKRDFGILQNQQNPLGQFPALSSGSSLGCSSGAMISSGR